VEPFDLAPRTRVVFGAGALSRLGELARELGLRRTLLVADRGLQPTGHPARAQGQLEAAGLAVTAFSDFGPDPDSAMVERAAAAARSARVDSFVAIGGGSSLDCAKGANFLLTNGGRMADYRGYGRAARPLLPMIGLPTTAGRGARRNPTRHPGHGDPARWPAAAGRAFRRHRSLAGLTRRGRPSQATTRSRRQSAVTARPRR
jgi:alcohol dehydrogenase